MSVQEVSVQESSVASALCAPNTGDSWDAWCVPQLPTPKKRTVQHQPVPSEVFLIKDQPMLVLGSYEKPHVVTRENIEPEVRQFLFNLSGYGHAVIAGGYIRDLCTGQDPSDVDVFTEMSYTTALSALQHNPEVEQPSITQLLGKGEARGPSYTGDVHYVLEFFVKGVDIPVQLIGVSNVSKQILQEFPTALSRVQYHHKHGFSASHSFLRDVHKKTITVKNFSNLTDHHVNKLKVKFLDWEFKL